MGGGDGAFRSRIPVVLVTLLLLSVVPSVHATNGSGVIDEVSFGIYDYDTFSTENYSFTLELHETDGSYANVELNVSVKSLEGVVLQQLPSQMFNLSSLEQRNVTVNLTSLDYGFSEIHVELLGEVGIESGTHLLSLSRTIQRLRPLSLELGAAGSILSQGVDSLGAITGNLSIHDGDYVQLQLPVSNQGDVNWTGSINVEIENGPSNESIVLEDFSVEAMSSVYASITTSFSAVEGLMNWSYELNGTLGENNGQHSRNGTLSVLAPPLPELMTSLISNSESIVAGELLVFHLNVSNNGTVEFNGTIECNTQNEVLLTTTEAIAAGSNFTWEFSMTAKPVTVNCSLSEGRIGAQSTLPIHLTANMESASFASAGSVTPSLTGGPWHLGDSLRANMLIRNVGDLEGRVRMVLVDQSDLTSQPSVGDWLTLKSGEAGEVSSSFLFIGSGEHVLEWALESDDGSIDGVNAGNFTLPVMEQQSIGLTINEVVWSQDSGLSFEVVYELDEGKPRDVLVQLGYETSDTTVYLFEYVKFLEQGMHTEQMSFGQVNAEKIVLKISAEDWSIGPGALSVSVNVPEERTVYWVEMEDIPQPILPAQGDTATIKLTLHQSGPISTSVGNLILKNEYDEILSSTASPSWGSSQSLSVEMDLVWPKGSNVVIQAVWSIDGTMVSDQESYVSGEPLEGESESMPVGAIIWGLVGGLVVSLVLRIRMNRVEGSSSVQKPSSPRKKASSPPSQEKIEVQCPDCDRRLRVPSDYSGSVGCPDCSTKFDVEAQVPEQEEPDSTSTTEAQTSSESKKSKDGKIEISCPDCSQTLRIPESYVGSVRCPACSKVFKAEDG
ncbi:MAG: hypothetical protein CMA10_00120 [Euryarchaeota archaeon]|nr:hypothetical protein [Euryarchaeota archaeon]|tara:strand:- start:2214 stop:4730 length:2517 start_codon:yes stop_codon:yes gene_type:complete